MARHPSKLRTQVRPTSSLTAAFRDRCLEQTKHRHDSISVRFPTQTFALIGPLGRGAMSTSAVAPLARRHLVLEPTRSTLDSRYDVLGRRRHQRSVECTPTPHAAVTIAFEVHLHA